MRDWWVVVPVRDTRVGKSRLVLPVPVRRALAAAMLLDTVRAVGATATVAGVVVVCATRRDAALLIDPPTPIPVLPFVERHPRPPAAPAPVPPCAEGRPDGLNAAVTLGARLARRIAPGCRLAALPADLPVLDGHALAAALALATAYPRAFSPDAAGTGTTLLTAAPGHQLRPRYGPGSSARHRSGGAVDLRLPGEHPVRHDVDDVAALRRALARGVGPWTARASEAGAVAVNSPGP